MTTPETTVHPASKSFSEDEKVGALAALRVVRNALAGMRPPEDVTPLEGKGFVEGLVAAAAVVEVVARSLDISWTWQ